MLSYTLGFSTLGNHEDEECTCNVHFRYVVLCWELTFSIVLQKVGFTFMLQESTRIVGVHAVSLNHDFVRLRLYTVYCIMH